MNIAMIRAAQERLRGHVRETPVLEAAALNRIAGRRVLVKAECLQHTGSFKYRGGRSAVSMLAANGSRGIIAYSSGNHAQGVARAAAEFGLPAVIVMPADAPAAKVEGTRALGAEVVLYDRATEVREEIGLRLAGERGLDLVKPYDDAQVIAGQGTLGLELARQVAEVSNADVLVCCGGGGLSAGVALALEAEAPGLRLRTVEPEGFDDTARSLALGRRVGNERMSGGLCDAILTPMPGELTFPILSGLAGPGLVVSEDEALHAMALAARHLKIVAEPGGVVALAAALFRTDAFQGETVIAVVTGGNVDPAVLIRALEDPE